MGRISDAQKAFRPIYSDSVWGPGSGVGSMPEFTGEYVRLVETFLRDYQITSVVDFGCGDWQFSRSINWGQARYDGFDVVESVVAANAQMFAGERVRFHLLTDTTRLPSADLLLCKDVLQHLPLGDIKYYLKIFKRQYKYMLITNDVVPERGTNADIAYGGWRPVRPDMVPFGEACQKVLGWDIDAYGNFWTKHTYLLTGTPPDRESLSAAIGEISWTSQLVRRARRQLLNLRRAVGKVPGVRAIYRALKF